MKEFYKVIAINFEENICLVHFDDETVDIPLNVFFDFNLSINQVIDKTVYQAILQAKKQYQIKEYITKVLMRKDVSSYELESILIAKFNLDSSQIQSAINVYRNKGLINDQRFLLEKIPSLIHRNYGYLKIEAYLEEKGFSKQDIMDAFSQDFRELEKKQALVVCQKYIKIKNKTRDKLIQGLIQKLSYCGYQEDVINETLKKVGFTLDF